MYKVLRVIYTLWGVMWFWIGYLMLLPCFAIIVQSDKWHKYAYWPNKIWAFITYFSIAVPVKVSKHEDLRKGQQYIFCANHNSYLDIPLIGLTAPCFVKFIGKSSLGKVPVFGYMFNRLHITVDRTKIKSRYMAFQEAATAAKQGFSLAIFPEGKLNETPPTMSVFKEGAFRVAAEQGIPVVPITILNHWRVLPDKSWLNWHPVHIIYHQPIFPTGTDQHACNALKESCHQIIKEQIEEAVSAEFESKN